MDFSYQIRHIRQNLQTIRDAHYAKHGFTPVKKKYQSRKNRETDSNFHLKQLCRQLKLKGVEVFERKEIDIINDDIFHTNFEEKEKIIWKKLENDTRIEHIENFMASSEFDPPISDNIKMEIVQLLKDGKLLRKKDVEFDEVNGVVTNILALKYDEEYEKYYLNLEEDIKKKKRTKRLKKIFS